MASTWLDDHQERPSAPTNSLHKLHMARYQVLLTNLLTYSLTYLPLKNRISITKINFDLKVGFMDFPTSCHRKIVCCFMIAISFVESSNWNSLRALRAKSFITLWRDYCKRCGWGWGGDLVLFIGEFLEGLHCKTFLMPKVHYSQQQLLPTSSPQSQTSWMLMAKIANAESSCLQ